MPAIAGSKGSLTEISKQIVKDDPVLQQLLKGLIKDAISVAIYTMKHGTSTDKMQLMRTLTPHMLEALRDTQQSDRLAQEQQAYDRIREALKGDVLAELSRLPPIAP